MILLKITRDEAREVQRFFFPYLLERCLLKMRDAVLHRQVNMEEANSQLLVHRMMHSLITGIKKKFDRKLLTIANVFTINHTDAEAIAMYQLLMIMPLDGKQPFQCMLRQRICNFYFDELCLDLKMDAKILSDELINVIFSDD